LLIFARTLSTWNWNITWIEFKEESLNEDIDVNWDGPIIELVDEFDWENGEDKENLCQIKTNKYWLVLWRSLMNHNLKSK